MPLNYKPTNKEKKTMGQTFKKSQPPNKNEFKNS